MVDVEPIVEKKISKKHIRVAVDLVKKLYPLLTPFKNIEIWVPDSPDAELASVFDAKELF